MDSNFFPWMSGSTSVDSMKKYGDDMALSDMTVGISEKGMEKYREDLKHDLLNTVIKEINDTKALESAINKNWQGVARDRFIDDFNDAREKIGKDLNKEYKDLSARLVELETNYFAQDYYMLED